MMKRILCVIRYPIQMNTYSGTRFGLHLAYQYYWADNTDE